MAQDEYHEAILDRIHAMQREIARLSQREALSYAYLVSREIPEEAARMLIAEMLLDYWARVGEGTDSRSSSNQPSPGSQRSRLKRR
jgi:hypothetical protein